MTTRVTLTRTATSDEGTFGRLEVGELLLMAGELPERGNESERSCIAPGIYQAMWTHSEKFGYSTYELQDVPGRSAIRIHSGNFCGDIKKDWQSDVEGCILLGRSSGPLKNKAGKIQIAILASRDAIRIFEVAMAQDPIEIEIIDQHSTQGDPS